ncbi:hypothetical protein AYI68_g635 [Smittium mucronatum]|uniref:Uncharacterized protein n=1 Tax=Smittium mucronatum TaxID=133383 RepID=A0A1R0H7W6_9FUNG|nr:hypothetical protein AYI68_g635 [Smittium mucronatum]
MDRGFFPSMLSHCHFVPAYNPGNPSIPSSFSNNNSSSVTPNSSFSSLQSSSITPPIHSTMFSGLKRKSVDSYIIQDDFSLYGHSEINSKRSKNVLF